MKFKILNSVLLIIVLAACQPSNETEEPYVILISIDGMRYDYLDIHDAPNLKKFAAEGTRGTMIPSFPTKTFPNHYTLVTGLYPVNHGIVANSFYDPESNSTYATRNRSTVENGNYYGGVPLWVLAENHGIKSACYYWIGSEAEIKGVRPTYYYLFDGSVPEEERTAQVVKWLELPKAERPRFITLYFELIDDAGHQFGPDSEETGKELQRIDSIIGNMVSSIAMLDLPVNYVLVSDHGMINVNQNDPIDISAEIPRDEFKTISGDIFIMMSGEDTSLLEETYQKLQPLAHNFSIYRDEQINSLNYGFSNSRFGNLLLIANPPHVFGITGTTHSPGAHGYNPSTPEMGATFVAWGPKIKQGLQVNPFENVHVYPMIANLLNLNIDSLKIDGSIEVLEDIIVSSEN